MNRLHGESGDANPFRNNVALTPAVFVLGYRSPHLPPIRDFPLYSLHLPRLICAAWVCGKHISSHCIRPCTRSATNIAKFT